MSNKRHVLMVSAISAIAIEGWISLLGGVSQAQAQTQQVGLGQIALGGSGCPSGTTEVLLSPDASTLIVRYSAFGANAGGSRSIDRKACALAIPIQLPLGLSVALVRSVYVGNVDIGLGASARISSETFIAGSQGPGASRQFEGPLQEGFVLAQVIDPSQQNFSACGESVILRTNTSVLAQSASGAPARISIEASGLQSSLVYHLQYKACGPTPAPTPPSTPEPTPSGSPVAPTPSPDPSPAPSYPPVTPDPQPSPPVFNPVVTVGLQYDLKGKKTVSLNELISGSIAPIHRGPIKNLNLIVQTERHAKIAVIRDGFEIVKQRLSRETREITVDLSASPAPLRMITLKTRGRLRLIGLQVEFVR